MFFSGFNVVSLGYTLLIRVGLFKKQAYRTIISDLQTDTV